MLPVLVPLVAAVLLLLAAPRRRSSVARGIAFVSARRCWLVVSLLLLRQAAEGTVVAVIARRLAGALRHRASWRTGCRR